MYGFQGSNFPDAFSRGVAIQQLPIVNLISPDNSVLWVDANSTKHGYGTYKDPFATIDDAIGKASAGDTILIAAGHTENLSSATIFQVDVNNLTIIGLGVGARKPTFSATALAGCVNIDNQNCHISNIRLVCNVTDGATNAVDLDANGCTLDHIDFLDTSATKEWLVHVNVVAAATDLTIHDCMMIGAAGTMSNSILFAGASTRTNIVNNYIDVDSSDDVIDHLAAASVNLLLEGNTIINRDTDAAGYCFRNHNSGTGVARFNHAGYNKVDAEVFLGAAMFWFENKASNTIAESGLLDPATSHAIP
jgi:hypothetical protein